MDAERWCAFDVAQNPFQHTGVNLSRSMHVEAHLLHGEGDVGPCEGECYRPVTCTAASTFYYYTKS